MRGRNLRAWLERIERQRERRERGPGVGGHHYGQDVRVEYVKFIFDVVRRAGELRAQRVALGEDMALPPAGAPGWHWLAVEAAYQHDEEIPTDIRQALEEEYEKTEQEAPEYMALDAEDLARMHRASLHDAREALRVGEDVWLEEVRQHYEKMGRSINV